MNNSLTVAGASAAGTIAAAARNAATGFDGRLIGGAIVLVAIVIILTLMRRGWRSRQARQSGIPRPPAPPAGLGDPIGEVAVLYVASTTAGDPLDRIAVAGLGFRARGTVLVHPEGVILDLTGEPLAFLATNRIHSVERATWAIDRAVEPGGLAKVTWTLGDSLIDSYFRVTEPASPAGLIDAIKSIIAAPSGAGNEEK